MTSNATPQPPPPGAPDAATAPSPLPSSMPAPTTPKSPLKEWATAVVLMLVFSFLSVELVLYLRRI